MAPAVREVAYSLPSWGSVGAKVPSLVLQRTDPCGYGGEWEVEWGEGDVLPYLWPERGLVNGWPSQLGFELGEVASQADERGASLLCCFGGWDRL